MHRVLPAPRAARREAGIVLPVALILLVVIALVGVAAMRKAITAEAVTTSVRANTLAMQAAEIALRYCETQALAGAALVINPIALDGDPVLWRSRDNWADTSPLINILPASSVARAGERALSARPRCLIETYRLRRGDSDRTQRDPLQITAVGYSPDYRIEGGNIVSGGEVWLQSVLRLP
jgi:Tfp pilus assembly protein PilX